MGSWHCTDSQAAKEHVEKKNIMKTSRFIRELSGMYPWYPWYPW